MRQVVSLQKQNGWLAITVDGKQLPKMREEEISTEPRHKAQEKLRELGIIHFDDLNYVIDQCEKPQPFQEFFEETQNLPTEKKEKLANRFKIKDFKYFKNLKKDKRYIIDGFVYPKNTIMWYSPPGQFKSLLAMHMGLCVANGKPFLGLKTKKQSVLVCDMENNEQILKERLLSCFKGMKLRRHDFPLYFLVQQGNLDNPVFIERLKKEIVEKNVKLLIFDTLHRFADYKENEVDDINRLYTSIFQPIIDECDCSIMFLHHTNKEGGYRGSSDFLGMVDTAFSIKRVPKTTKFVVINEKSRMGEAEEINGEIVFEPDYIHFLSLSNDEIQNAKISKLKEITTIVKGMFAIAGDTMTRREILDQFEIKHFKKYSVKTIDRTLKFLVREDFLKKEDKGIYSKR